MEPLYVSAFLKEEGPSCIVSTYTSQVAYQIVYSLGAIQLSVIIYYMWLKLRILI